MRARHAAVDARRPIVTAPVAPLDQQRAENGNGRQIRLHRAPIDRSMHRMVDCAQRPETRHRPQMALTTDPIHRKRISIRV